MELLLLIVIIGVVIHFYKKWKRNAAAERERKAIEKAEAAKTPEERQAEQAWKAYSDSPCQANLQNLEEALKADTKHWKMDFLMGIRYDTGIDGIPFDREQAGRWYASARDKAKAFGNEGYVSELDRFFSYYNRPYGNFKNPDILTEQTRRIQSAVLMMLCYGQKIKTGVIPGHLHSGEEGFLLQLTEAEAMIRQMKNHSRMVLQLLEDYDVHARRSSTGVYSVAEYEGYKQRFNQFIMGYGPDVDRKYEPGMEYQFFVMGLLVQSNGAPYLDCLQKFVTEEAGVSMETFCVKYFSHAYDAASSEALYMELKLSKIFQKIYKWDDANTEFHHKDHFMEYVGNVGWCDSAKRIAEEFFPGTNEKDWIFD